MPGGRKGSVRLVFDLMNAYLPRLERHKTDQNPSDQEPQQIVLASDKSGKESFIGLSKSSVHQGERSMTLQERALSTAAAWSREACENKTYCQRTASNGWKQNLNLSRARFVVCPTWWWCSDWCRAGPSNPSGPAAQTGHGLLWPCESTALWTHSRSSSSRWFGHDACWASVEADT